MQKLLLVRYRLLFVVIDVAGLSHSLSLALAPCSMYMTKLTWLWCCCCWCVRARPEPLAIRGSSQRCDNCIVDYVVVRFSQKKSTKYWLDKRKEFLAGRHHARCIHATHTTGFVTIKHTHTHSSTMTLQWRTNLHSCDEPPP